MQVTFSGIVFAFDLCELQKGANTDQNAKNSDRLCEEYSPTQGSYAGFGLELEDAERSGAGARLALG